MRHGIRRSAEESTQDKGLTNKKYLFIVYSNINVKKQNPKRGDNRKKKKMRACLKLWRYEPRFLQEPNNVPSLFLTEVAGHASHAHSASRL